MNERSRRPPSLPANTVRLRGILKIEAASARMGRMPSSDLSRIYGYRYPSTAGNDTRADHFSSLRMTIVESASRRSIQLLVHIRVPHDGLHVFAGFGEGNRLDEFLNVAILAGGLPVAHSIIPGVVGCESILEASELVHHRAEITRPQLQIDCWGKQLGRRKML